MPNELSPLPRAQAALPTDRRLIETWLPIAALGIESLREHMPMTPFPAPNRLHVWWARRPLVASRAAILASILPADVDHAAFTHMLGIHGDPVAAKARIAIADRKGERLGADAYGYPRAFGYVPSDQEKARLLRAMDHLPVVLDPTAGGGSIPFEATRLGLSALANDLNPVAATILNATVDWPARFGPELRSLFLALGARFVAAVRSRLEWAYPREIPSHAIGEEPPEVRPDGYLWARSIRCPYCEGLIPLSPNWRLAPDGAGVRLHPHTGGPGSAGRVCGFEIVRSAREQSGGTVADGDAKCPFPDCGRGVDGDEVKRQAQAGGMGEQLYAVVTKTRVPTLSKSGKRGRDKWQREYRAPRPEDDNSEEIAKALAAKLPEWEALGLVPSERFPPETNDDRPIQYGMPLWRDLFSPRQLLGHGTAVEVFHELWTEDTAKGELSEAMQAAFVYLALSLDKLRDYNSRMARWHSKREVVVNTFDRHDFAFKWSYAEMAPLITGLGYDWAIEQTGKCIKEVVELSRPDAAQGGLLHGMAPAYTPPPVTITCKSADALDHIADASVDVVVIDPPYYDNVMYAELSDFFYVWLKRTAGLVLPELFTRPLTDKENEAVANPAKFAGQKGAKALAGRDYQARMALIFAECRRVLKPNGIMTVMFPTRPPARGTR